MSYTPPLPPPPMPESGGYAQPRTSGKAVAALVTGVLGLPGIFCCGFLSGIPAIILGLLARRDIKSSSGRLSGDGLALSGLVLGVLALSIGVAFTILFFATDQFSEFYGEPGL